jgi:Tfp pilus assembly protein PilX
MDVIYKLKINQLKNSKRGFVLITAMFIMLLILSLALYATSFALTEMKISDSQKISVQTYYLAEAGIAEAIWKIKNDPTWKTSFEENPAWSIDYTRESALYPNGSYLIQVRNTGDAKGEITVTAYLDLGLNSSRRMIKTIIYKALGESAIGNNGEFADGNIDMSGSILRVYNGGIFSNNNIIINYWSVIDVDKSVSAVGNINVNQSSIIRASSTYAHNYQPAPAPIAMPAISFDNIGDPDSYKSRANNIYTASQFSDLLWNNRAGTLTLEGINYVTGDISIKGSNNLIINGTLVADGNITVGENTFFCCWGINCGRSNIVINNPGTSTPSGLLSKGRIDFELCLDDFNATGLIYANDKINILSLPKSLKVTGGLVSRKLTLTSLWQGTEIIYDDDIVNYTLGDPQFSPIVTVEHWEEQY